MVSRIIDQYPEKRFSKILNSDQFVHQKRTLRFEKCFIG